MKRFGPTQGQIWVYTFKEGLLSNLAHDLKIRVGRFTIEIDEDQSFCASIDPSSLQVICAQKGGKDRSDALSPWDLQQCQDNMMRDILRPQQFPEITFKSTRVQPEHPGLKISGDLTLHGKTRSVSFHVAQTALRHSAEIEIDQRDFGIKPFSAALGALKVKPTVRIVATLDRN